MLASGAAGVVIERVAYRPLRTAPRIAPLISALGVSFFLQNTALLLFGADIRSYDTFDLGDGVLFTKGVHAGPLNISLIRIIVIASTAALCVALTLWVARSRIGKAMRATSHDREAAAMMGIDVDRTIVVTFLVGSLLAGVAGVMVGLVFQRVSHFMGFFAGLKGFTAAVVGGIGSIPGAMVGGLLIGVAEAMATGYLPQGSTFQDLWVFVILIVFLLVRPTGLFGKADIKKV
jgi:branched-chain amino acid transport system permease protein